MQLRSALPTDLHRLIEINDDVTSLFTEAGLVFEPDATAAMAAHEHAHWLAATHVGRAFVVCDGDDVPVGFCVVDHLGGDAWLAQLAVCRRAGRRGLGSLLIERAATWAQSAGQRSIGLTTWAHLSWNAPFYARRGFVQVAEADCSPAVRDRLAFERAHLPAPEHRIVMRRTWA